MVNISHMEAKSKIIQRDSILQYLEQHPEGITVRDMVVKLNINSPTKRISELVSMGFPIEKSWAYRRNSIGEKKRYMRYRLRKENNDV